jgi:hypothetical protein
VPDRDRFPEKMRNALTRAGAVEGAKYNSERFALEYRAVR